MFGTVSLRKRIYELCRLDDRNNGSPRTVCITGATDGIGLQTALDLAAQGSRVILHGRDPEKLSRARELVERAQADSVAGLLCFDLSSLAQTRELAKAIIAMGGVDALVANAGVFKQHRELSTDGYEMTFAVNHLANVLLTHELLPALRARRDARIVLVSSGIHAHGTIDFADLQFERSFDGRAAYARSKLANVLFGVELAKRLGEAPTVNSLHPGVVSTKLLYQAFGRKGSDSPAEGAKTSVHLCLSQIAGRETGGYWVRSRRAEPHPITRDRALAKRFYEESCAMVGVTPLPSR